jgi:predicted ATP-grasp superfamily ATP-dependent carboligase
MTQAAPILLTNAHWYGTLAATRTLGQLGVPVYVASDGWLGSASWSRYTARKLPCPALEEPERFLDWLCELGRREPGIVLYPTSDEATFLYATRLDELSSTFRTYQPGLDTVLHVLDKKRLYATARDAGIEVPETWFPESEADVERIAREAPMPLLIKPRTQVLSLTHSKGIIVRDRSELLASYRRMRQSGYGRALLARLPDAGMPMIQRYFTEGAQQIHVLAAFRDRERRVFAARSGYKIFQRPRSLGIGLCFVDAPLDLELAERARDLADRVGYYGLYQLEFIRVGKRDLLIDFNPRFYNQLAYDVARGLPLPQLVYSAACGETHEMQRLVAHAGNGHAGAHQDLVFCNDFGLRLMLATQVLTGMMSAAEAARWRRWRDEHHDRAIDPAKSPGDDLPALVDMASQIASIARHPRAFVRKIVLDLTIA